MHEHAAYPVPENFKSALIGPEEYAVKYRASVEDPENFWRGEAQRVTWMKRFNRVKNTSFEPSDFHIRWFEDGTLNLSANCLDRHLPHRANDTAILWEPDDPAQPGRTITYGELHAEVCRFANALRADGVKKGDRVTIYLPMVPEAAVAMLACARIGAVHSIVFAGFSPDALAGRIEDLSRLRQLRCPARLQLRPRLRAGGRPVVGSDRRRIKLKHE